MIVAGGKQHKLKVIVDYATPKKAVVMDYMLDYMQLNRTQHNTTANEVLFSGS